MTDVLRPGIDFRVTITGPVIKTDLPYPSECPVCHQVWRTVTQPLELAGTEFKEGQLCNCYHCKTPFIIVSDGLRPMTDDEIRKRLAEQR